MKSVARRPHSRPTITSRLVLLALLIVLLALTCAAVDVGDAENRVRFLLDDGNSEGDVGCPDVKTLAVYNGKTSKNAIATNTSAQIVDPASCSKPLVVNAKQIKDKESGASVYELNARKQGIWRVASIPSDVNIFASVADYRFVDVCMRRRLDNNSIESFKLGRSRVNSTTQIYLSNNSILSVDNFEFPASLLTLDLTNNLIQSIDKVLFPANLAMLNLTLNPIESLRDATLPPKLRHLNMAGCSIGTLENFSFPSSIASLNFSANPITRIAGVIFPTSLDRLVINAGYSSSSQVSSTVGGAGTTSTLLFAKQVVSLEEFEVRRTDADRFQKLNLFAVSGTSGVKCSDPLAKFFYVNDTMLCVLSDEYFDAKYAAISEAAAIADGTTLHKNSTHKAKELPLLHETWHQSRSWFLLVSAVLLMGFVVVVGVCGCCHASVRRVTDAYSTRKSETAKPRSADYTRGLEKSEKETESLLSIFHEETIDEGDGINDLLPYALSQKLNAFLISPNQLKFPAKLPKVSLTEAEAGRGAKKSSGSQFVYTLASVKNQTVMLKTLRLHARSKSNKVEFDSNRSAFAWDRGRGATLQSFSREIELHSMVSHANIVSFIGYLHGGPFTRDADRDQVTTKSLTLAMEYMDMGTLDSFIEAQKIQLQEAMILQRTGMEQATDEEEDEDEVSEFHEGSFDIPESSVQPLQLWAWDHDSPSAKSKLSVVIDIARALLYLHSFSPTLFHGNLSSRKVLLDSSWHVKVSDLSCSSALRRWSDRNESGTSSSINRSSGDSSQSDEQEEVQMDMTVWTAPEVIDGQQYTTKADMYSFGVLLSYLDTYEFPVDALLRVDSEVAILSSSSYNVIPTMSSRSPMGLRTLTTQCLAFQPEGRPSADQALKELLAIQRELKDMSTLGAC